MDNNRILGLLGLALRGGHLVMGEEPVEAVVRARDARILLLASDAADNTLRRAKHFADIGQCLWLKIPFTKDELGSHLGRFSVAIIAITDIGLAAAVVHRLAAEDPDRYSETAVRLDLKAQRAAERKAEMRAHEKNVRTGKCKAKAEAAQKKKAAVSQEEHRSPYMNSGSRHSSRPSKGNRPRNSHSRSKANPYANSRPVKKGKGSFRSREGRP